MKKWIAFILALALLCLPALAMEGEGYPAYEAGAAVKDAAAGNFGAELFSLEFDGSQDYSYLRDGYLQACFFAFDASGEHYLEFYLLLPEKMQAGDVLTPQSCFAAGVSSCSLSLFEIEEKTQKEQNVWFAGQVLGAAYPANSSYSVTIEKAEYSDAAIAISGKISAQLCILIGDMPGTELLPLELSFDFTLPLSGAASPTPAPTQAPQSADVPREAVPAFTLPPDYIVL